MVTVLYRNHLRYSGNDPHDEGRDYLVLSKGHGVMAQYACMHELGWLDDSHIQGYLKDGSNLKGLSDSRVPGLEVTSGSLGHGFSVGVGVGIAMGMKRKGTDQKVYAIVGNGEPNEGLIWESCLLAAHHQIDDLMLIVDKNGFQAMGTTDDVLALGDLAAKFTSFGFETLEVDGHDEAAVDNAIRQLWDAGKGKPKALIATTVYAAHGPVYLRMGKADLGDVHTGSIDVLKTGRLLKVRDGRSDRPGLIAIGSMLRAAVDIA